MTWPFGTVIKREDYGGVTIVLVLGGDDVPPDYKFGDGYYISDAPHGYGFTLQSGWHSYPVGETCAIDGVADSWAVVS